MYQNEFSNFSWFNSKSRIPKNPEKLFSSNLCLLKMFVSGPSFPLKYDTDSLQKHWRYISIANLKSGSRYPSKGKFGICDLKNPRSLFPSNLITFSMHFMHIRNAMMTDFFVAPFFCKWTYFLIFFWTCCKKPHLNTSCSYEFFYSSNLPVL